MKALRIPVARMPGLRGAKIWVARRAAVEEG
jgi:hypothetical protein